MSHRFTLRVFGLIILASGIAVFNGAVEAQIVNDYAGSATTSSTAVKMNFGSDGTSQSSSRMPTARQNRKLNPIPFRLANDAAGSSTTPPVAQASTKSATLPTIRLKSQPTNSSTGGQEKGNNSFSLSTQSGYTPTPITDPVVPQTSQETAKTVSNSTAKYLDLENAIVNFMDVIMLPAQEAGVIKSLDVKEGDSIPAGKIVGMIDDELAQKILEQAKLKFDMATEDAEDTTAIRAAEAKYKVADIEAKKKIELWTKGSSSDSEKRMAVYTKEIAKLEIEKAIREKQKALGEQRMAAAEYYQTKTRIEHHTLRSDFAGNVVEILKKPQEYVQPGDAVMRIGRMDRLWVQGTVSVTDLNPHEVLHKPVTVTLKLAHDETATFEGQITNVSVERSSRDFYMVKAEVENRPIGEGWIMQPLGTATIRIHLDGGSNTSSFSSAANPGVNR